MKHTGCIVYLTQIPFFPHLSFRSTVCSPITRCELQGEYAKTIATPSSDSICANLTRCTPTEYQSVAPTPSADRSCANLRACTAAEYESQPPTVDDEQYITNRQCAAISQCNVTEYQSLAPTTTTDAMCTPLTLCGEDIDGTYESRPPTYTTDRQCQTLTDCEPGQVELRAPTPTSDRACDEPNTVRSQVRLTQFTPDTFNESVQHAFRTAAAGVASRAMAGSTDYLPGADNVTVLSITPGSVLVQFTIDVPDSYAAAVYEALQNFDFWLIELLVANPGLFHNVEVSDIVCAPPQQYAIVIPIGFGLKVCVNATQCVAGEEYETGPVTATSDRECRAHRSCDSGEFEVEAPTATTDRVCQPLTSCEPTGYETVAPTATTDRQCSLLTECVFGEYEAAEPTPTSDR